MQVSSIGQLRRRRGRHRRRLADPGQIVDPFVAFPAVWVVGALLAWWDPIGASSARWTPTVVTVMVAVPLTFVVGGLLARNLLAVRHERHAAALSNATEGGAPAAAAGPAAAGRAAARTLLVGGLVAGFAELAYQFSVAGGVPLLSSNIDSTRVAQPGGPTVVLIDFLTVAIICGVALPERLRSRAAIPDLMIAGAGILGFALSGGRGSVVLGLMAAIIARGLLHGFPRKRVLIAAAMVGLTLVSVVFFARTNQHRENPFEKQLYEQILPRLPVAARAYAPLHYGLATNFDVLAAVVGEFPASTPHHFGRYSASGFDLFIPGTAALGTITARLTGPFVTSTAAGPFWADGGLVLTVIGMGLIGFVTCGAYSLARRRRTAAATLVAGHLTTMAIFGVYTNLFTDHPDWVIILPALAAVGLVDGRRGALPEAPTSVADWVVRYTPQGAAQVVRGARAHVEQGLRRIRSEGRMSRYLLPLTRRAILIPAALVAALVIGAITFDATSNPKPVPIPPPAPLPVADRFKLPQRAVGAATSYATDGDNNDDNAPLWAFRYSGATTRTTEISFEDGTPAARDFTVPARRAGTDRVLDVGTWSSGDAVFEMTRRGSGVETRVLSVRGEAPRVQATGFARLEAPSVKRELAIATWDGPLPDLFIIDRGGPRERVRVTIWSGESSFATKIADLRLPLRDLDPRTWLMDAARLTGTRPDVAALSLLGTGSKHPEAQILKGDANFKTFALQGAIALRPRFSPPDGYMAGKTLGRPSLYLVDGSMLVTIPVAAA